MAKPSRPKAAPKSNHKLAPLLELRVRRIHRRDINRLWEFLKLVFRDVNRETVEYQRPHTKQQFSKVYEQEGVEQLIFEVEGQIVGYAECAYTASDSENWVNPRYFDKRGMRPLFVEELAVHPKLQGHGVGQFMLEQLQHLGRARGCTHLVLEVAQNNKRALTWYHKRNFFRLDAAIFLAQRIPADPELLPPRPIARQRGAEESTVRVALGIGAMLASVRRRAAAGPRRGAAPADKGAAPAPRARRATATEPPPAAKRRRAPAAKAPKVAKVAKRSGAK